jgi:hypothetical protein
MSRSCYLLAIVLLLAACAGPQAWWQRDLQEWQGAPVSELLDAWGPPLRTLTDEDEETVLVYESARELDHRLEKLRDPGAQLGTDRTDPIYLPIDRTECRLYFEIADEHVAAVRHEGSACDIVPRDPARRIKDPAPRRGR